ncbi:N/A [soil metagenome]
MLLVYVAAGGALGALARYGIATWVQGRSGGTFPWGTLAVNLSGSFLLGLALPVLERLALGLEVRALVAVGLLGAFTTFSTFSYEAVQLLQAGEWVRAGGYVFGSVVLGLLGVTIGLALGTVALRT